MNTENILTTSSIHLESLSGHVFDLLSVSKPISPEAAVNLAKVISKLSPLVGNLIEFNTVEFLNDKPEFQALGYWKRQDPDFPDALFVGSVSPAPGFEIKAWFPLATEITARFKDSQNHFQQNQTNVCLIAWLPEKVVFGRPRIIDVCVVSGLSVAQVRDNHYHNPPDYLVIEPRDTKARTKNLQQTNTNGYKWQGTQEQFEEAKEMVKSWGENGTVYKPTIEYQEQLSCLIARFPYRLDTNFAKMDRIVHPEIEKFKTKVLSTDFQNLKIGDWSRLLCKGDDQSIKQTLAKHFDIKEEDTEQILQ
jgi:hypothetical protein